MNKALIIFLGLVVFTGFLLSITSALGQNPYNIENSSLSAVILSSGVLIATLAFARDTNKLEREGVSKRDEQSLAVIKSSFDEVYDLLKDLNNDRIKWIRAARVLLWAVDLGDEIQEPNIKKSYWLLKEKLRINLYILLQTEPKNPIEHEPESLPGQFFYGISDWKDRSISMNDAALKAHPARVQAFMVNLDKVVPSPKNSEMDPSSIVAIYDFIKHSNLSEVDPLKDVKLWEGDGMSQFGIYQGPANYIAHQRMYYVVEGELKKYER